MSFQIHIPDYIIFEDPYLLVVNKPAGLMVEPDRNGYPNLLNQVKNYVKQNIPADQSVYVQHIHRLDRPVSGIILFVKQREFLKNLSEQFAERKVKKFYQALTMRAPEKKTGKLENWIRKEKKKGMITDEQLIGSELASLQYNIASLSDGKFLWNIELHTGKFHQIRAQLANIGCPIIGDLLYGSDVPYKENSIALHACKLVFFHPASGKELVVSSSWSVA